MTFTCFPGSCLNQLTNRCSFATAFLELNADLNLLRIALGEKILPTVIARSCFLIPLH